MREATFNRLGLRLGALVLLIGLQLASVAPAGGAVLGSISGTVTNEALAPLADVYVTAYDNAMEWAGSASTDASGDYTITGLAAGSYYLFFNNWTSEFQYVGEWWDNATTEEDADPVVVGSGPITGIDAALSFGGSISGTVTDSISGLPLEYAVVTAYSLAAGGWSEEGGALTDANGEYTIWGLPGGDFAVWFDDPGLLEGQYWANSPYSWWDPVTVVLGANTPDIDADLTAYCDWQEVTILGTMGVDVINGTAGADVIQGGPANDTINGLGGDDTICGGPGRDILRGGGGYNSLLGEAGDDTIYGGPAGDSIEGGAGKDLIYGNGGSDWINGDASGWCGGLRCRNSPVGANDTIYGGDGHDNITAGQGDDIVYGQGGDDEIVGDHRSPNIYDGNDTIYGGLGNDEIDGGRGIDRLYGNEGADYLFAGGPGDEVEAGGTGQDTCYSAIAIQCEVLLQRDQLTPVALARALKLE